LTSNFNAHLSQIHSIYEINLYQKIFQALVSGALLRGWQFEIVRTDGTKNWAFQKLKKKYDFQVFVTNVKALNAEDERARSKWAKHQPFVYLNQWPNKETPFLFSYVDVALGIEKAVLHFKNEGFKQIDFLAKPTKNESVLQRFSCLELACEKYQLKKPQLLKMPFDPLAKIPWLSSSSRPEALLCFSDLYANEFHQRMLRHKLNCPEDIALHGFDGISLTSTHLKLSSVSFNWSLLGENALKLAEAKLSRLSNHSSKNLLIPPTLEIQESSLKKTKNYLKKHKHFLLKAHEILEIHFIRRDCTLLAAQACQVGKAHFQRLYQQITHRSFSKMILEKRLVSIAEQIKSSSDAIYPLAEKFGFKNHIYFYRAFKVRFGMTPKNYRLTYEKPNILNQEPTNKKLRN
jgi:DNA-binding LacI/PurR family transcriptional regulator